MTTGRAKLAGVMGWPVGHSLSPLLHGFWLQTHAIDGAYVPLAVKPEDFASAVRMLAKLGFAGANVTIPHKQAALACVDELDDVARRIGAVNTIVKNPDFSKRLAQLGADPVAESPDFFAKFLQAEIERWAPVVKASGAKPE